MGRPLGASPRLGGRGRGRPAPGDGERCRPHGWDVVAGRAAGPEGERVRRHILSTQERLVVVGIRQPGGRVDRRPGACAGGLGGVGVVGRQGGGVSPADRRRPHPGGHGRVGGGNVRAPDLAGWGSAVAHALRDPECGASCRRVACDVGWCRPVSLGEAGRLGVPGADPQDPHRGVGCGVGPGPQRHRRDGRVHPGPVAPLLETDVADRGVPGTFRRRLPDRGRADASRSSRVAGDPPRQGPLPHSRTAPGSVDRRGDRSRP